MQVIASADAARPLAWPWLAPLLAVALPALLAYNLPPSSTMLNQCAAVALWGGWLMLLPGTACWQRSRWPLGVVVLLLLAALASGMGGLPSPLVVSLLVLLLAAGAVLVSGAGAAAGDSGPRTFTGLAIGLLAAGGLSAVIALLQAFLPDLADGNFIARSGLPGRAVGNLRQPNHLCSLLLWGVIAAVALLELRRLALKWALALVVLMVFAVELSASRTGALGLLLLVLWGVLDKRLSRPARWLLVVTPLIYAVSYGAMALFGHFSDQAFGAEARLAGGEGGGESPNARPRIWANALAMTVQQPWFGVGFGEFNFAWSLTAIPGRPTAFFDHTHTLPLQLAVELGVPLALLVMGLLVVALWQAWRCSGKAQGDAGTSARAAWMLVLLIGLHSLFEYPLWYAYFLLPTAFAWGFALGSGPDAAADARPGRWGNLGWWAGGLMVVGALYATVDYLRIASIYSPGAGAAPLNQRIADGQRSLLFGHHADYAAATSPEPLPGRALAFERAPHHLLDTRLMMAWAKYLVEQGQVDQARWLAERLREFRNPASDEFFEACSNGDTQAFQCQPPQRAYHWREFVRR